ncbi:right-handed parallel beta-helix repeat-containing protein [Parafilimonas sp.]|uniref:alpha-1,3-galactosidase-related protein n=1 Tax=Parafilimonas sp. TaxID=1969739 RepID=UPI0039E29395
MIRFLLLYLLCCSLCAHAQTIDVTVFGARPNSFEDATESVQKAIESCRGQSTSVINFPTGRYDFWPGKATETHYYISNTSDENEVPVKDQKVGLMLKHLKNITIEGNGSLFVFHGKMITWVIDSSENIQIKNVAVNYERPGMSEMTIKSISPTAIKAVIHPDSKFAVINGKLEWYGEGWKVRPEGFFAALVKPATGTIFYSSWLPFYESGAEVIAPLTVTFTGNFSKFKADTGDVLTIRDAIRDYVAAFQNRSKNISLHDVQMYSLHGLGIVSQFCENLDYDSVLVAPQQGSGRVIASSADGMHFSGCKGQITISHCRFKGLHDDPVNVHGTHLQVTEIISPTTLKLRFMHHQTYGFMAFDKNDSVAFVHAQSLQTFGAGIIKSAKLISEREMQVELQQPVTLIKPGDVLENITWTPSLTIKNSRFETTISRGTLITTRRKVIIENNVYYRTGMHAILIADDASGWYESGPVMDVTIRNNQFIECGYNSFPNNYIINIQPEAHQLMPGYYVHKNITIENNLFKVYDYPVLFAKSTNGLVFSGNTITKSNFMKAGEKRAAISLTACAQVKIAHNKFEGWQPEIQLDGMKKKDIKADMAIINERKNN